MGQITPEQVGEAVVKAIPAFFSDAIDQLRQGEGAYIRSGMPEGVVAQIGQAVARSACRRYGANPSGNPSASTIRFETACRPYLESLNPGDGAKLLPPFQGGQCAVPYQVFARSGSTDLSIGGQTPLNINGPLSSPAFSSTVVGSPFPDSTRYQWIFPSDPSKILQFTARASFNPEPSFRIAGRTDGGLDNCGNPPSVVTQPAPRADPLPPPFRFNPGPGIDVGIDVDINPDGTITFDIGGGPKTVDPFEPSGGTGGGGGGGDPTAPGSPGASDDSGSGGESEGAAGDGEELVGVLIEVLSAPLGVNTFDNVATTVYRGIGYVRMGYPGRLGLDTSGSAVVGTQFFHAQQRGLTNWRVNANVGFNLRVTPYYRSTS